MKILAIVGPDGSGKSSLVDGLRKKIDKFSLVYCGRKNFHYKHLEIFDRFISNIPSFLFFIKIFLRYCIYYPIEFIDIRKRLSQANLDNNGENIIICERFFVDRAIRYYELCELRKMRRIRAVTFFYEYLFSWIAKKIYLNYLKKTEISFVFLSVNHLELFSRNKFDYRNIDEAQAKSVAYEKIFHEMKYVYKVKIDTAQTQKDCVTETLNFMKYEIS